MGRRRIAQRFYNETAAIEEIQLLSSFSDRGRIPYELFDFLINCDRDDFNTLFPEFDDDDDLWMSFRDAAATKCGFPEWFYEAGFYGFMVKFATPIMNCGTYSWGMYVTQWVYGDTVDEAMERGFKWVASQREAEAKKAEDE